MLWFVLVAFETERKAETAGLWKEDLTLFKNPTASTKSTFLYYRMSWFAEETVIRGLWFIASKYSQHAANMTENKLQKTSANQVSSGGFTFSVNKPILQNKSPPGRWAHYFVEIIMFSA
jgi:hypothetical protein